MEINIKISKININIKVMKNKKLIIKNLFGISHLKIKLLLINKRNYRISKKAPLNISLDSIKSKQLLNTYNILYPLYPTSPLPPIVCTL